MNAGIEACEAVLAVALVVGLLVIGHLVVVIDMERGRRRRRRR